MIRFWRSLTKKDRVQSDRYEITHFFAIFVLVFGRFFTDPDFYGSDPDFRLIQIRTQKKRLIQNRGKKISSYRCPTMQTQCIVSPHTGS